MDELLIENIDKSNETIISLLNYIEQDKSFTYQVCIYIFIIKKVQIFIKQFSTIY